MRSRRRFLQCFAGALVASRGAAQKRGVIVRAARPENFETPLGLFSEWITPIEKFYVRSHHGVVRVDPTTWKLEIAGAVSRPLALTMAELRQMPRAELVGVLECAGNGRALHQPHMPGVQWEYGAVGNARWSGVRLRDVLERAGLRPGAREILFDGADTPPGTMPKFQRTVPRDKALDPNTLLAFEMNGQPLPVEHGFPLRLVAPGWAGDSWVKWLTRIQPLDHEFQGFFMTTAYRYPLRPVAPGTAVDPKEMKPVTALRVKSVIWSPRDGEPVPPGGGRVRGAAWSGESPVAGVEVSTDGGRNWRAAALGRDEARFAWRLWDFDWKPAGEGYHVIMARARDASGEVQPLVAEWNPSGYLWNAAHQVGVSVSTSRQRPAPTPLEKPAAPAPHVVKTACLPCHGTDIMEQQRLTPAQWEREIDKMIRWGAPVKPEDRPAILKYLLEISGQ